MTEQDQGNPRKSDPTPLTTAALLHETEGLRDEIRSLVRALEEKIGTRLDAADDARKLNHEYVMHENKIMMDALSDRALYRELENLQKTMTEQVSQLENRHNQKFNRLDTQIAERDIQTVASAVVVKEAVATAFAGQKEVGSEQNKANAAASAKAEASFTKQIDAIAMQISAGQKATDEKITTNADATRRDIDDLKNRITAAESAKKGGSEMWVLLSGVVLVVLAIGTFVAMLSFKVTGH
jgi:hypothetical protein